MPSCLRYDFVGHTLVVVQNARPVVDDEWQAMASAAASPDYIGFLVWTNGLPNTTQRNVIRAAMHTRPTGLPPLACMIDPALAKTMSYVFELFWGSRFRLFAPDDFEGAFAHAQVPSGRRAQVTSTLELFRKELDA